mmetsp:Transcript_5820/g.13862  ORF Transcript_5820/g.13862 Transcript_5820/m.13862 type:complete len:295 (-) Transcript_5820:739-1623(-)
MFGCIPTILTNQPMFRWCRQRHTSACCKLEPQSCYVLDIARRSPEDLWRCPGSATVGRHCTALCRWTTQSNRSKGNPGPNLLGTRHFCSLARIHAALLTPCQCNPDLAPQPLQGGPSFVTAAQTRKGSCSPPCTRPTLTKLPRDSYAPRHGDNLEYCILLSPGACRRMLHHHLRQEWLSRVSWMSGHLRKSSSILSRWSNRQARSLWQQQCYGTLSSPSTLQHIPHHRCQALRQLAVDMSVALAGQRGWCKSPTLTNPQACTPLLGNHLPRNPLIRRALLRKPAHHLLHVEPRF